MIEAIPKHHLTGEMDKLETNKECLPAIKVKNTVRWVNEDFTTPYKLKVGEQCELALFLTPKSDEHDFLLEIMPKHNRSALLGRLLFSDKDGNKYREIDLKGVGYIEPHSIYREKRNQTRVGKIEKRVNLAVGVEGSMGLTSIQDAEKNQERAELFFKNNIRAIRTIAIIELQEIVDENGEKISIKQAEKLGIIPENFIPCIEARAMVTKARIDDLDNDNWEILLQDAIKLFAQETQQKPENINKQEYIKWFAKTLGAQVARIHQLGFSHQYLTPHNITLDCRILDFDSVQQFTGLSEKEQNLMKYKLRKMMALGLRKEELEDPVKLSKLFDYIRAFHSLDTLIQKLGFDKFKDREFLEQISNLFQEGYVEAGGEDLTA